MTTKAKKETVAIEARAVEFYEEPQEPQEPTSEAFELGLDLQEFGLELQEGSLELTNEFIDELISKLKSMKTKSSNGGPNVGVGKRCRELILEGLSNKDVLVKIKKEFPNNNTTYSCVAWYRNDMKSRGQL